MSNTQYNRTCENIYRSLKWMEGQGFVPSYVVMNDTTLSLITNRSTGMVYFEENEETSKIYGVTIICDNELSDGATRVVTGLTYL